MANVRLGGWLDLEVVPLETRFAMALLQEGGVSLDGEVGGGLRSRACGREPVLSFLPVVWSEGL